MSLVEFLVFTLGGAGLTLIIVLSILLEPIRDFLSSKSSYAEKLLSCTMCTGFWVGGIASIWFEINPLFAATMVSLVSWVTSSAVEAFNTISLYLDSYLEDGENNERSEE